ncbi:MAG: helix-turn-helix domain-containing protein [Myxococcales bacterium]|nr:helix-turn-helix domain-containing protein [Myxococcales bacterium]
MSRATDALLATVAANAGSEAANDEVSSDFEALAAPGANPAELTTWIDALALTLAAGLRAGATGLALPSAETDPDVLTVDDVAGMLQLGRNAVYESVGRNEIPHRRIGKQIRFSRRGVMRWLDSWSSQGAKEGK